MPKIAYLSHPVFSQHEMGEGHPEQPDRVRAIEDALVSAGLMNQLVQVSPIPAEIEEVLRVHEPRYIRALELAQPDCGDYREITPDTVMNCHTWRAALYAAGTGITAVDKIFRNEIDRAFCNVRPPGHHAERSRGMGFCFMNNVAVATAHALEQHGLRKVAIVDFDVHHGNGTEDIFRKDPRVLLCSTFQHPLYPGSGADTISDHIVNVPLPEGTDGQTYRRIFENLVLPALERHEPELVVFSAGFDAHKDDQLASMALGEDDYYWITEAVINTTRHSSSGRVVSMLEGGYNLKALAASAAMHIEAMIVT